MEGTDPPTPHPSQPFTLLFLTLMANRRRSSATTATKTVKKSPVITVTKYTQPREIKKVTETPKVETKVRPETTIVSFEDYKNDFKVRWEIHNWEVNELLQDIKKAYTFATPYVKQATDYTIKTFTQVRDRFQSAN